MSKLPDPAAHRRPDHPIHPLFIQRWSPRAMSGEAISDAELMSLFEAARWAPSTYNEQEWRFFYARRGTPHFDAFMDLLLPANRVWCAAAGVLVVVASQTVFTRNGNPNPVHTFDTGAAFENLALQGASMGLVVHGMAGFDWAKAPRTLRLPANHAVQAMIAIGRPGDPASLPAELREREIPTSRKPVREIAFEGGYPG